MIDELMNRFSSGDRRALARLITMIENEASESGLVLDRLYDRVGGAVRIGVTGPPGAGKSTLVDQLTKLYRKGQSSVAIIAVDPTSPFTGGALLGDRIRMNDLATDQGVFIRSMATRGNLGGLSEHAIETADLMDAFGFDVVIFETVGVGQSELDIAEAADTTLVVLVPESGDSIQAMKAGLMEIADIFVINKSDRLGADRMLMELQSILELRNGSELWQPVIVNTIANAGEGIIELAGEIENHIAFQQQSELLVHKQKNRIRKYIIKLVQQRLHSKFWTQERIARLDFDLEQIIHKKRSPYAASLDLVEHFMMNNDGNTNE
ncbi:methylmalonyl Co-A mutase-associated GTPase MeaB [candidate division KSB1 bacterium]|nr:methylmalonyl Co-A mutase-associated GTPase MeaB [candidate division KSB1 bacterium]